MSRTRLGVLMVAALLVLVVALYVTSRRNQPHAAQSGAFVPGLAGAVNSVTEVTLRRGGPTPNVTLHKQADKWTVAQRADYPADVSKLRKLLMALSDARIVEEKTSLPENFPAIGVEDPALPSAGGVEIVVVAPAGKHTLIVGKPAGLGNFARRDGDQSSYVVEPGIAADTDPRTWIDTRLLDVPSTSIQRVEVKPAAGAGYITEKTAAGADGVFSLSGVPAGRKALESPSLKPSATLLSNLAADDVAVAADIDFGQAARILITVADGNVLTLLGAVSGDKHWVQISSSKDSELNAKFIGRAFDIAAYRYAALFRPIDELLVPLPQPKSKQRPAPAP